MKRALRPMQFRFKQKEMQLLHHSTGDERFFLRHNRLMTTIISRQFLIGTIRTYVVRVQMFEPMKKFPKKTPSFDAQNLSDQRQNSRLFMCIIFRWCFSSVFFQC